MERRPKGEGGLFRVDINGQSLWRANKTVKHNGTSKRITGTGGSHSEARERLEANYKRWLVRTGQLHPDAVEARPKELKLTTGEWLYLWHSQINPERVDETTRARYRSRLELHLVPHIGDIPLKQLNRDHLDKLFRITLPAKRKVFKGIETNEPLLGGSALVNVYVVLRMALNRAVAEEKIFRNPIISVERPLRSKKTKVDTSSGLTSSVMIQLDDHKHQAMFTTAIIYGMRQSERLGLRWRDISLNPRKATLSIEGQLARHEVFHGCGLRDPQTSAWPCGEKVASKCPAKSGGGGYYWKDEPKNESSRRELPLVEPVRSMLEALKDEQAAWKESEKWKPIDSPFMDELVFTSETGQPIRQQDDTVAWHQLLEEFHLPYIRGHALRHMAVSLLIGQLNIPVEIVSKIMGHASIAVTSEIYTHLQTEDKRKPLEAMGNFFKLVP